MCQNLTSSPTKSSTNSQNSDSIAALIAAVSFIVLWLVVTHLTVGAMTDLNRSTLPNLPSVHCLMQNSHCVP